MELIVQKSIPIGSVVIMPCLGFRCVLFMIVVEDDDVVMARRVRFLFRIITCIVFQLIQW